MKEIDLCDAGLLHPFVGCLDRRSLDSAKYLERQHIPPELVASGSGKITRRQVWRFFSDIVRTEGIETIGFLDNDPYSISYLGPAGAAVNQAVTLRDAIQTFCMMISRITASNTAWLEEGPNHSWLCCRGEDLTEQEFPTDHFTVMALAEIVRLTAGPEWRPTAVRLHTGQNRALDQAELVGDVETMYHRGMSAVRFPTKLLPCPLRFRNQNEMEKGEWTDPGAIGAAFGEGLAELLESQLPHNGMISINQAAEILGIHRSSLHRSLASEGLTWRRVLDRVRFKAAQGLLDDQAISVKSIAFHLGYSDPSNFKRAFRRMTGLTPTEFRKRKI